MAWNNVNSTWILIGVVARCFGSSCGHGSGSFYDRGFGSVFGLVDVLETSIENDGPCCYPGGDGRGGSENGDHGIDGPESGFGCCEKRLTLLIDWTGSSFDLIKILCRSITPFKTKLFAWKWKNDQLYIDVFMMIKINQFLSMSTISSPFLSIFVIIILRFENGIKKNEKRTKEWISLWDIITLDQDCLWMVFAYDKFFVRAHKIMGSNPSMYQNLPVLSNDFMI